MKNNTNLARRVLCASTALSALSVVLTAAPAFAQTTEPGAQTDPNAVPTTTNEAADEQGATQNPAPGQPVAGVESDTEGDDAIVVTGTILRATAKATPSPVQVLDMDESEKRGVNTVNDAIQSISANGAGTLPNSFTANGAFAAGAAAASLRGLLTSNTLVLFDGLRAAYYPLADDGTRNFVDLNTIPDAIVDRVEVLKDGASSTYGADAVAGVVNIITKRQINGLHINASGGVSKYGDAGERKLDLTYGYGDLDDQGFNVYVSGGIYKVGGIEQKDRKFPYNEGDLCGSDINGGFNAGFGFSEECSYNIVVPPVFFVRPSGPNDNIAGSNQANPTRSDFQLSNPATGCGGFGTQTLTDADRARILDEQGINLYAYPDTFCTEDWVQNYFDITAPLERQSLSLRGTVNLSDSIEAYGMVNWMRSHTWYEGLTSRFRRATPPALGPTFNSTNLSLPVWICPNGSAVATGPQNVQYIGCTNPDGTPLPGSVLNPNNPFAGQGSFARVVGYTPNQMESDDITTKGLRGAVGVSGEFGGGWRFAVDGTLMRVKNNWTQQGSPYYANMYQAIATGAYNFVNPELNSQAVMDFIFPEISTDSKSTMAHLQGNVAKDLMELPGGPLQVGIGAAIRREEIKAPSANPDRDSDGNPILENTDEAIAQIDILQRFSSGVNPFGTSGKRTVKSVYGEILAPVINEVDINLSGRYDSYSTGQSNFSPKAGIKVTPIRELAFRGTYSKGFRIGSFAESFGTPSTGYIGGAGTLPDAYVAQIPGGATNGYVTAYNLGLTQTSNPDLDPEKSRNITLGFVAEPIRNVSFSVDYWNIKKDDVITGADYTPALAAYYAGQAIPDGFVIIPDLIVAPPAGVPANFIPRAAFVQYQYINAATQHARGIDFATSARVPMGGGFTFGTNLEATRLLLLDTCFDTGCQRYDDTIGPYVITSAAGSPKWRGSWQNTLEYGRAFLSLTAFYTKGYYLTAEDIGEVRKDCSTAGGATFNDGTTQCKVKDTLYWNLAGGVDVTDDMNVYFNINNLFDKDPPLDTMTYGGYLYNPAWANTMIIGRYFRVGAKLKM